MFAAEYQVSPGKWLPLPTAPVGTLIGALAVVAGQVALEDAFPTMAQRDYRVVDAAGVSQGVVVAGLLVPDATAVPDPARLRADAAELQRLRDANAPPPAQAPTAGTPDADTEELRRVVAEVERRWRERTPATSVDEVNASYRVSRGEIRAWCKDQNVAIDETDDALELALIRLFMRLREEFPGEQWEAPNVRTKELCKKYGVKIPRKKSVGQS